MEIRTVIHKLAPNERTLIRATVERLMTATRSVRDLDVRKPTMRDVFLQIRRDVTQREMSLSNAIELLDELVERYEMLPMCA